MPQVNATQTAIASATTATPLLSAHPTRKSAMITNASTSVLYLLFGTSASPVSATNHSMSLAAGGTYQLPSAFNGPVTGIWVTANGFAQVTEFA